MNLLSPDSKFMVTLGLITDYILVNILALLCCMPIITIGAAMSAKYYVAMKITRGEEPAIAKSFFKSFKENFKQSTIVWLIAMVLILVYTVDWYIIFTVKRESLPTLGFILLIMTLLLLCILCCVFPILARFNMTIKELLKASLVFALIHLPRMLLSIALIVFPIIIGLWYIEWFLAIWLLFSFVSVYYNSIMFVKHFKKLEEASGYVDPDEIENENSDYFRLKFDDEDDESEQTDDG